MFNKIGFFHAAFNLPHDHYSYATIFRCISVLTTITRVYEETNFRTTESKTLTLMLKFVGVLWSLFVRLYFGFHHDH